MAQFITRIELQNAAPADYEILHAAMAKNGFTRSITAEDGSHHPLPNEEYNRVGELRISEVADAARLAANKTGRRYSLLVTQARAIVCDILEMPGA